MQRGVGPVAKWARADRLLLWGCAAVLWATESDGLVSSGGAPVLRDTSRWQLKLSDGRLESGIVRPWGAAARKESANGCIQPLEALRGGSGLAKKLGGKNLGLLMVALSILLTPSAMSSCSARIYPGRPVQRMGCGVWFMINNIITLTGIGLVLVNSRKFDRYGRSKFKMRLTGSVIIFMGMLLVISHAETARINWYSKTNVYMGIMLEWWGFASLFYNFTPKFVAQVPRELSKLLHKGLEKAGMAQPAAPAWSDPARQEEQQREVDRLNRWAQAQAEVPAPPPPDQF